MESFVSLFWVVEKEKKSSTRILAIEPWSANPCGITKSTNYFVLMDESNISKYEAGFCWTVRTLSFALWKNHGMWWNFVQLMHDGDLWSKLALNFSFTFSKSMISGNVKNFILFLANNVKNFDRARYQSCWNIQSLAKITGNQTWLWVYDYAWVAESALRCPAPSLSPFFSLDLIQT